jgi:hypothetical protein
MNNRQTQSIDVRNLVPIPPTTNIQSFADQPIEIDGTERPRIAEGVYKGRLIGHITSRYRSSHKVEFRFAITLPGIGSGGDVELGLFFEVKSAADPTGPGGTFAPKGPRSKLAKLLAQCQEVLGISRPLSINELKTAKWELTVGTVNSDWDGHQIPTLSQYSVIRSVKPIDPRALEDW